jgi:hypothetical protein
MHYSAGLPVKRTQKEQRLKAKWIKLVQKTKSLDGDLSEQMLGFARIVQGITMCAPAATYSNLRI